MARLFSKTAAQVSHQCHTHCPHLLISIFNSGSTSIGIEHCPPLLISMLNSDLLSIENEPCPPLFIWIFNSHPKSNEDDQYRPLLISIFNSHSISIKWSPLPVLIENQEHGWRSNHNGLCLWLINWPSLLFWLKKSDEREFNFNAKKVTMAFVFFKSGTFSQWT